MSKPAPDGPWLDQGAADPRLMLSLPATLGADGLALVERAITAASPAALLIDPSGEFEATRLDALARWIAIGAAAGTACLVLDDPVLALNGGADGVHLSGPERVAAVRRALGAGRLLGAACGVSRHAAMVAGDEGVDYVLLGGTGGPAEPSELLELVRWWSELFVLPCAVPSDGDPPAARRLIEAGADFLILSAALWDEPAAVPGRLADLAPALRSITAAGS